MRVHGILRAELLAMRPNAFVLKKKKKKKNATGLTAGKELFLHFPAVS